MSLNFRPKEYTQCHALYETIIDFFKGKLTTMGWDRIDGNEVHMDVGCGSGATTRNIVLPFFSDVGKIIALDVMPGMIEIAREQNAHPRIEYFVADITKWSAVEQWEEKIAKITSIHCFQWIKQQKEGFQNIYRLLKSGGEAAFYFPTEACFFDITEKLQSSSRWSQYLQDRENGIADSHRYKYGASYYKTLMEGIGFEILHCDVEDIIDVHASDETIKNFFSSLCVLSPYIPLEHKEDFENDMAQQLLERGGRTDSGLPRHKAKILEMIVRKK